jgi:hypothetical protein
MRWSERPPAVRSRFAWLEPFYFKRRPPSVAIAHLVLVRWCARQLHESVVAYDCRACGTFLRSRLLDYSHHRAPKRRSAPAGRQRAKTGVTSLDRGHQLFRTVCAANSAEVSSIAMARVIVTRPSNQTMKLTATAVRFENAFR